MTQADVSKFTYAELLELRKSLEREIQSKQIEELKTLVDGFAKKIEAAGFTVAQALNELRPYARSKANTARPKRSANVLYRDPENPSNVWSGRGRAARWIAAYEKQGRSRDEFKVS